MAPTVIADNIPITNTGKVKLELIPGGIPIPVEKSILILPGSYRVVAHPIHQDPVFIASINYNSEEFKVTPANQSVKDARFAVDVNFSEP